MNTLRAKHSECFPVIEMTFNIKKKKMIRTINSKTLIIALASASFFFSCVDNKKNESENSSTAQMRLRVLTNIGDNLVQPLVNELKTESDLLYVKTTAFNQSPDVEKLDDLREQWEKTFKTFLQATYFEMNPVKVIPNNDLTRVMATFPVNTQSIEDRITDGIYSTNNFLFSTRGLNTVEYLIFGHNKTKEEIVESFSNSNNRKIYLDSIVGNITRTSTRYKTLWESYLPVFKNDPNRTQNSAITELFNRFIVEFERTKNDRLQSPLGQRPGQTQRLPQEVDARFSAKSLAFFKVSLDFSHNIWRGKTRSSTDSTGLDDLLESVSESGRSLAAETRTSWSQVFAAFDGVDQTKSLETLATDNDAKLLVLSAALRDHTAFVKSRFTTVTGILSDHKTGDGD